MTQRTFIHSLFTPKQSAKTLIAISVCATSLFCSASVFAATALEPEDMESLFKAEKYEQLVGLLENKEDKTPKQFNLFVSSLLNIDLDDAEEAAEAFVDAYPDDYRAYLTHANVMGAQASNSIFSALGYAEKAKESLEQAVKVAPQEVVTYQALLQFHLMAPGIAGGDMDEAKTLVTKISEMDPVKGRFAKAAYLQEDDKADEAVLLLTKLSEQPSTRVKALFKLGELHIQNEAYEEAFAALSALAESNIQAVAESDEHAWSAFSDDKFDQLYGLYRIGYIAVETEQHTESGIAALTQYIDEVTQTPIDTNGLPTTNWANLRLAELYINANKLEDAKRVIQTITDEDDSRFTRTLKKLKKKV